MSKLGPKMTAFLVVSLQSKAKRVPQDPSSLLGNCSTGWYPGILVLFLASSGFCRAPNLGWNVFLASGFWAPNLGWVGFSREVNGKAARFLLAPKSPTRHTLRPGALMEVSRLVSAAA